MTLVITARPYSDPDVVRMVADVQQEYVGMYGGPDADRVEVVAFAPPGGLLLVGSLDGAAVAMGGWRWIGEQTAEIKRMYVAPAVRGRGLARELLGALEVSAVDAGVRRLVLSTGRPQVAAIALYEACGYTSEPPYGYYADQPLAVFLAKTIA